MSEQIKEIKELIKSLEKNSSEMISASVMLERKYKGSLTGNTAMMATDLMQIEKRIDGLIAPAGK